MHVRHTEAQAPSYVQEPVGLISYEKMSWMAFKVTSVWELLLCYTELKPPSRLLLLFLHFPLFGEPNTLVILDHRQLTSLVLQAQWNERFGPGVPRHHLNAGNRGDEHTACFAVCFRLMISAHCVWNQFLVEVQVRIHIIHFLKATCYLPVQTFHSISPKTWCFFFLFNNLRRGNMLIRIN